MGRMATLSAGAPRPMTMAEKALARASDLAAVRPGAMVQPDQALVILHDGYVESTHSTRISRRRYGCCTDGALHPACGWCRCRAAGASRSAWRRRA